MRTALLALVAVGAAAAAGPLRAQPLTREDLLAALKARDAEIAALEARVAALERERAAPQAAAAAPAVPAAQTPPIATLASAAAPREPAPSDDELALQALSRTLVQRGGQLLPPWRAELIPSFAYSNREVQGLALVPTPEGISTVANQRLRDDHLRAAAALRVGLPWRSQIEVQVPYEWIRQSRALGDGTHLENEGSGFGDISVEVSHELMREAGWRPDLVGALSYRAPTGRDPFRTAVPGVATGGGFHEFRARLTAVKASDPLVFFGTLSYVHDYRRYESIGTVQPGDGIGLDLGAVLAVSPESSLTFALAQEFRARTRFEGVGTPGTDTTASVLQIGLGQVLTPNVLLDVTLGVGLTRDAPDYALQVSLPIRLR